MRFHPDVSVFASVQLAQFFVGRRLDEPEAGNDAPAQGAGHEDTQRRQEPAGENRDDSDQPDECQGEIQDGVVDADDEVFHGAYSLRNVEKIPLSGGRRKRAITMPSLTKKREPLYLQKTCPLFCPSRRIYYVGHPASTQLHTHLSVCVKDGFFLTKFRYFSASSLERTLSE